MADEGAATNRRKMLIGGAVVLAGVVFVMMSQRELPEGMSAAMDAAQQYVDAVRAGQSDVLAAQQSADFVAPTAEELATVRKASFLNLSESVLGENARRACVGGGIGDSNVTTSTVRLYLLLEDGSWKISRVQVVDNFDAPKPPWPRDWAGAPLQGNGACALGY